ncbi:hypothetical protein HT136_01715 [Novosphingobium profundi]|uniref:hypothetical protein n=1 Tax=Novosphingobium profundi TaxID=1774954 RepID=UPI001BDB4543|nr:hypothetical protein [Novosphingobium profundi]MBT0667084.1 hypothetical protein [Novosphingobium profundi]
MAQQTINLGSSGNDGTGDNIRAGGDKINANFDELYAAASTIGTSVPASATATGAAGLVAYDADYIYVCVAPDTWKRAALSTW